MSRHAKHQVISNVNAKLRPGLNFNRLRQVVTYAELKGLPRKEIAKRAGFPLNHLQKVMNRTGETSACTTAKIWAAANPKHDDYAYICSEAQHLARCGLAKHDIVDRLYRDMKHSNVVFPMERWAIDVLVWAQLLEEAGDNDDYLFEVI